MSTLNENRLQLENSQLRTEKLRLENELAESQTKMRELTHVVKDLSDGEKTAQQTALKIQTWLDQTVDQLKVQRERSTQLETDLTDERDRLKVQQQELLAVIRDLEQRFEKVNAENSRLFNENRTLLSQMSETTNHIAELDKKLKRKDVDEGAWKDVQEMQNKQLDELSEQLEKMHRTYQVESDAMSGRLETCEKNLDTTARDLENALKENEELKAENAALERQLSGKEHETNALGERLKSLETTFDKDSSSLRQMYKSAVHEQTVLELERSQQKLQESQAMEILASKSAVAGREAGFYKEQLDHALARIEQLEKSREDVINKSRQIEADMRALIVKNETLETKAMRHDDARQTFDTILSAFQEKISGQLKNVIANHGLSLKGKDSLEVTLSDALDEIKRLRATLEFIEQRESHLKQAFDNETNTLRAEIRDYAMRQDQLIRSTEIYRRTLERKLLDAEQRVEELHFALERCSGSTRPPYAATKEDKERAVAREDALVSRLHGLMESSVGGPALRSSIGVHDLSTEVPASLSLHRRASLDALKQSTAGLNESSFSRAEVSASPIIMKSDEYLRKVHDLEKMAAALEAEKQMDDQIIQERLKAMGPSLDWPKSPAGSPMRTVGLNTSTSRTKSATSPGQSIFRGNSPSKPQPRNTSPVYATGAFGTTSPSLEHNDPMRRSLSPMSKRSAHEVNREASISNIRANGSPTRSARSPLRQGSVGPVEGEDISDGNERFREKVLGMRTRSALSPNRDGGEVTASTSFQQTSSRISLDRSESHRRNIAERMDRLRASTQSPHARNTEDRLKIADALGRGREEIRTHSPGGTRLGGALPPRISGSSLMSPSTGRKELDWGALSMSRSVGAKSTRSFQDDIQDLRSRLRFTPSKSSPAPATSSTALGTSPAQTAGAATSRITLEEKIQKVHESFDKIRKNLSPRRDAPKEDTSGESNDNNE